MRRLILMRHAKSDWGHASLSDHDRPLNDRGALSAAALGRWLAQEGYAPDEVLCSSAARTRATLEGLSLDSTPVKFLRSLYLAEPEEIRAELVKAEGRTVLLIAHNPGINAVAHELVENPPEHPRFQDYPTGATTVIDFDIEGWNEIGWHQGQPIAFVIPRELIRA